MVVDVLHFLVCDLPSQKITSSGPYASYTESPHA
jgi:hypothetical protein